MPKAVLSDLDGTIIDSEKLLYRGWDVMVAKAGHDFSTFPYATIVGKPDLVAAQAIIDHYGLDAEAAAFYGAFDRAVMAMMPAELVLRPGAYYALHLIDRLKSPLALVTSSPSHYATLALRLMGIEDLFKAIVTCDHPELKRRKPFPDPYLLGAKLLGVDPKDCRVLEDSPSGARSGKEAGCYVIGYPHEHSPVQGLIDAGVDLIVDSLMEITPELLA